MALLRQDATDRAQATHISRNFDQAHDPGNIHYRLKGRGDGEEPCDDIRGEGEEIDYPERGEYVFDPRLQTRSSSIKKIGYPDPCYVLNEEATGRECIEARDYIGCDGIGTRLIGEEHDNGVSKDQYEQQVTYELRETVPFIGILQSIESLSLEF